MGISQNGPKDRKQIYEEYPYEVEKKLRVMIAKRDKSEAQDALHVLLEYLFDGAADGYVPRGNRSRGGCGTDFFAE